MTDTEAATLPALAAGISADVDEQAYHQDRRALSQSGAKLILKSPAHFRWWTDNPPEPKKELDHGSAAHARVLGVGQEIVVIQRRITDRKGNRIEVIDAPDMRSASAQEHEKEIRANGQIPLLAKDFAKVQAMEAKLREHRLAQQLLAEGEAEVTGYARDEATGVWTRGRFDWINGRTIVDYKTSTTSQPDAFIKKAVDFGYDLQVGWYLDLAEAAGHPVDGFAHLVQESSPPFVVTAVVMPASLVARGRVLRRRALERYRDCIEADRWPGYVPDDEFATPAAPAWALREVADEIQL